jgi:acyl-CoA thioesterase-1
MGPGIDFTGDLIYFDCNWIRHAGVVLLILTVVRLVSFFSITLLVTLALTGCAQKSAEPEAKVDIPMPTAATPPADTRPVVLCYGDSITAGYGLEAGKTYPDVLQKLLDEKGYKYHVVNAGISGDTTQSGLDRLTDALSHDPKITLLELGGNDGLRGIAVSATRDNLVQIAGRLQRKGSKVVLLGITLPRNYGPDYIRSFEEAYKMLATEKKYPFMPFVLQGVYGQPGMMQPDGIHPTAAGAAVVAANVLKYLEPLLTK